MQARHNVAIAIIATALIGAVIVPANAGREGLGAAANASATDEPTGYVLDRSWTYSNNVIEDVQHVDVGPAGEVYAMGLLADSWDARIRRYDPSGTLLTTWDVPDASRFDDIRQGGGLEVESTGNVLVGSKSRGLDAKAAVLRYSPQGQLLQTMLLPHSLDYLRDLTEGDGNIWGTDPAGVIHQFSPDGVYQGAIGAPGTGPGQFDHPEGIDLLPSGNLVVADTGNDRVQIVTPTGAPVVSWGQAGRADGQFTDGPQSVEVRADGLVYVTDSVGTQVFTESGAFVARLSLPVAIQRAGYRNDLAFGPAGELVSAAKLATSDFGVARFVPGVPSPSPSPTAQPSPSPSPSPAPLVRGVGEVAKKALRLRKKRLLIPVMCPVSATGGCVGKVRVKSRPKSGKARALAKAGVYELVGSAKAKVKVRVTKKGLRWLRTHRKAVVILTAEVGTTQRKVRIVR